MGFPSESNSGVISNSASIDAVSRYIVDMANGAPGHVLEVEAVEFLKNDRGRLKNEPSSEAECRDVFRVKDVRVYLTVLDKPIWPECFGIREGLFIMEYRTNVLRLAQGRCQIHGFLLGIRKYDAIFGYVISLIDIFTARHMRDSCNGY